MTFRKSVFIGNKRLKLKNLTYIQQSNNKILTAKCLNMSDLCRVINWLFIILVLVSKKIVPQIAGHFLLGCIHKSQDGLVEDRGLFHIHHMATLLDNKQF